MLNCNADMHYCRYEVRKKKAKFADGMEDIAGLINESFVDALGRVQCGIVYCLSKADCEKVAEQLQSAVDSLPPKEERGKIKCKIKYGSMLCPSETSPACMTACMMFVLKLCPYSPDFAVAAFEPAGVSKPGPTGQHGNHSTIHVCPVLQECISSTKRIPCSSELHQARLIKYGEPEISVRAGTTMLGCLQMSERGCSRTGPPTRCRSLLPPLPLAWASTSRMCALSFIIPCPNP